MPRIAHLVVSTHWDREWYEPFQGYRMRLISLMDEVFDTLDADPNFKTFTTDGQSIMLPDYLEIKPEQRERIRAYLQSGRLKSGPWYVLPDEWLVSGESLIRNIQLGTQMAADYGGVPSKAGIACDLFGHTSQLPQIFSQLGLPAAIVWRGTHEKENHGYFNWVAPDGTTLPTYRFGKVGYCSYDFAVRNPHVKEEATLDLATAVDKLVDFAQHEATRTEGGPLLLFDGGDHVEIEPQTSALVARANEKLKDKDIQILHSDLDAFMADVIKFRDKIHKKLVGELRESSRDSAATDEHWLIPGVLSSRIHLKQRNAACEDELCIWAEPFSTFANVALKDWEPHPVLNLLISHRTKGFAYPGGFIDVAWKHLLENHPHDSICGCSIDQVHQDMIYRFDQSMQISSGLSNKAMKAIALAAAPRQRPDGSMVVCLFNATSQPIEEPIDFNIPLPTDWAKKYQEFFGFEEKFSFKLRLAKDNSEIPYQLIAQARDRMHLRRNRYKFPDGINRHVISVTAKVRVPAFGYTSIIVEPVDGPTRYLGSMASSHRSIENEHLKITANANGTINLLDKRTGKMFEQLLTFEDRADIGDGWFHGVAVNDQIFNSTASNAEIAIIHDGINKATLRINLTMNVPKDFHRRTMSRCETLWPLKITSDVTLRNGSDHVEVTTVVNNDVLDHRVRVLFPTNLKGDKYNADAAFDVVERPVALAPDNNIRRELDVETRPQQTWTSFGDGKAGLAIVSRGQPESAVTNNEERAIALTLFRGFRRAVISNDNPGGQIQGKLTFRYAIVPFDSKLPINNLFLLGQRIHGPVRSIDLIPLDLRPDLPPAALPVEDSFLHVSGEVVVTSLRHHRDHVELRFFNPHETAQKVNVTSRWKDIAAVKLDDSADDMAQVRPAGTHVAVTAHAKRIVTLKMK